MFPVLLTGVFFLYYVAIQPAPRRMTAGGIAWAAGRSVLLWFKIVGLLFLAVLAMFGATRIR